MNDKIKAEMKKILERIPQNKRPIVIIICGILLMAIIALPGLGKKDNTENSINETDAFNIQNEYISQTEEKLCDMISSIKGAGSTKVMLTLESSEENVYAADINSDKSEYVVIKTDSDEGGMLLKIIQPKIRGVAVVCEGGDNSVVKMNIINTVCSSLGVSSTKISIAKMKDRSD